MSIALAVHDLAHPGQVERFLIAWVVLAVAAVADGTPLSQTLRQARREAALWDRSMIGDLRIRRLRVLAVEDAAAPVGVAIAAARLLVRQIGGPAASDAIASLLIGVRGR